MRKFSEFLLLAGWKLASPQTNLSSEVQSSFEAARLVFKMGLLKEKEDKKKRSRY